MTLTHITEQGVRFTFQHAGVDDVRLLVNGSQLLDVQVGGINQTEGAGVWTYTGGNFNRIDIMEENVIILFFPQNNNTEFATSGRVIEGDFLNSFTKLQKERIHGWLEHYNINQDKQDKFINLLNNDRQKLYEIILKIVLDRFDSVPQQIKDFGKAVLQAYKENNSIELIIDDIENKVSLDTGRNDTGNVPNAGRIPNPT